MTEVLGSNNKNTTEHEKLDALSNEFFHGFKYIREKYSYVRKVIEDIKENETAYADKFTQGVVDTFKADLHEQLDFYGSNRYDFFHEDNVRTPRKPSYAMEAVRDVFGVDSGHFEVIKKYFPEDLEDVFYGLQAHMVKYNNQKNELTVECNPGLYNYDIIFSKEGITVLMLSGLTDGMQDETYFIDEEKNKEIDYKLLGFLVEDVKKARVDAETSKEK